MSTLEEIRRIVLRDLTPADMTLDAVTEFVVTDILDTALGQIEFAIERQRELDAEPAGAR